MNTPGYQRSRDVLRALIQGNDPDTGEKLDKDTVLNRGDVIRALVAAIAALESENARTLRRASLPSQVGKTWTEDEERCLRVEYRQHKSIPDIAASHGRTVRAIEARLQMLGLLRPEDRTTTGGFVREQNTSESEE